MSETKNQNSYRHFSDHNLSIPLYLIVTLLTCGLFNLYWNFRQMQACNELVGRSTFSWLAWFCFSLLTCGIYHLYYQYKMGSVIVEIQQKRGVPVSEALPVVSILLTFFGLSIAADVIHQHEINKLCV